MSSDQQQPARPERVGQRLEQRPAGLLVHADDRRDPRHDQFGLTQIAELDEPHPVGEVIGQPGEDPQGEPRLPDAARPAQGHGAHRGREPAQLGELALAADEAVGLFEIAANLI